MNKDKVTEAIEEFYIEIYKISEPTADFKELVENAIIDKKGNKHIPFNDYVVDKNKFNELAESIRKKYKLRSKWEKDTYSFHCHLGPTPKFK